MKLLQILVALVLLTAAQKTPTVQPLAPGRTVVINTVINRGNIMTLVPVMDQMAIKSKEPIHLIINSPGGDVVTGFMFINAMEAIRAKGIEIHCYVPQVAASMGFQIFLHCDKRIALSKSFLLWHGGRVQVGGMGSAPMTEQSADQLAKDLALLNKVIIEDLKANMNLKDSVLMYHYYAETLHVASNLAELDPGFLTVEDAVPGLLDALNSTKIPHVGTGLTEDIVEFEPGQLIHIKSESK